MRTVLVHGPAAAYPPLGALTLLAISKQLGIQTDLVAMSVRADATAGLARQLADYDLIGFSTECGTYPHMIRLAEAIKKLNGSARIAFGGPQATTTARETIAAFSSVDVVVKGEAEKSWPQLLDAISRDRGDWRDVEGAVFRGQGGEVVARPEPALLADIDEVPLPDYAAHRGIWQGGIIALEVGRGCPYGCTFCSTNTFFKRRFRMKSTQRILADINCLVRDFGVRGIDFVHDMFTVRRDTVEEIAGAMKGTGLSWNCSARTDRLDDALIQTMAQAGCAGIFVGIETGSQRLQNLLKKNLDVGEAIATIRRCQASGIGVSASIIIGFPNETRADLRQSLLCAFELARPHPSRHAAGELRMQVPFFSPLPGTPILAEAPALAFDDAIPSLVEIGTDTLLDAETSAMIRAHPAIFSAFYHPVGTEVERADYIVLMQVMNALSSETALLARLAATEAGRLIDYLIQPGISRFRGRTEHETCAMALDGYAAQRRFVGWSGAVVTSESAIQFA